MLYTAHLQAGGTIEMIVKGGFTPLNLNGQPGWVMDDNGTMINMAFVVALVPMPDTLPRAFVDGEGDTWTIGENGLYDTPSCGASVRGRSLAEIRETYGIDHAIA